MQEMAFQRRQIARLKFVTMHSGENSVSGGVGVKD
jgi:hypothetical protein